MSRIAATFHALREQGRKGLVPYLMAGDPYADATVEIMLALAKGGADVIELGIPFSDPMAEGPVIQKACERALAKGIDLSQVLAMVRSFRGHDANTPVVLMGYANPFEHYDQRHGAGAFVADARAAGVDGVLVVDYPPEECEDFAAALVAAGIDPIFLLAPTSTEQRMRDVGRVARGYAYCVSLKGVTGAAHIDVASVAQMLSRVRKHVPVPLAVGFGIGDAATAQAVGGVADAVVIGSRLVQLLAAEARENVAPAGGAFMAEIRTALDEIGRRPTGG